MLNKTPLPATLKEARSFIAQIDLRHIVARAVKDGDLLAAQAADAEAAYRQFLLVVWQKRHAFRNEKAGLCPSRIADPVWHSHIIHTVGYTTMCQQLFGRYIHHSPDDEGAIPTAKTGRIACTRTVDQSIPVDLRFIQTPLVGKVYDPSRCSSCGEDEDVHAMAAGCTCSCDCEEISPTHSHEMVGQV